jgi:predicted metal-dependent peptidase
MVRWAEALLSPKTDWRKILAGAVRAAAAHMPGAVDYSYTKPSRRQGQAGNGKVVLPSLRRPVPEVAVVVDTSGSIQQDELAQALAEVRGILSALGVGAVVLSVDSAVHTCQKVFGVGQLRLGGGGGTDMGVGIADALKLKPKPHVIVVLTDGYTPWGDTKPTAKVVAGILGDGPAPPQWAKEVRISVREGQ